MLRFWFKPTKLEKLNVINPRGKALGSTVNDTMHWCQPSEELAVYNKNFKTNHTLSPMILF